ncbi:MAG: IS110 family transposase [Solirubrobacterales bacterium]|nr:IS110 family transposase [Solirubrobacterales bacterium]
MHVAGESGEELLAATFAHDEAGLRALCRTLVRMKVERVAIERPDGVLIERLLDSGLTVIAIHPNQAAAARPRFRGCGGKSDRFDAFVLCELARTDHHRFRVLEPDSDATKALRALTRAREDLVHTRVSLTHQLRAELERFWTGPISLFTNLASPISLAFIERYPSPGRRADLGRAALRGGSQAGALPRWQDTGLTAREAQTRARGPRRRSRAEGSAHDRARARRRAAADHRPHHRARAADRRRYSQTPRRRDLPLVLPLRYLGGLRRDAALRDRRLPCALPHRRLARRRRRPSPGRDRVRQT